MLSASCLFWFLSLILSANLIKTISLLLRAGHGMRIGLSTQRSGVYVRVHACMVLCTVCVYNSLWRNAYLKYIHMCSCDPSSSFVFQCCVWGWLWKEGVSRRALRVPVPTTFHQFWEGWKLLERCGKWKVEALRVCHMHHWLNVKNWALWIAVHVASS